MNSKDYRNIREAYLQVYRQEEILDEDYFWELCLTEEFISEAYKTVADYLVYNEFVPGYNTAEVYMSEMAVEDIDSILFETGVLNEQYLMEAGFFQGVGAGIDKAGSVVSGASKRAVSAAGGALGKAGSVVSGASKRAVSAAGGALGSASKTVQGAGKAIVGGAQRAAGAVGGAITPVAKAVSGTAQRAVSAGQSALGSASKTVQGAGKAIVGGAQRAGSAVAGAAGAAGRKIGQEIEISRKVGAGEPPTTSAKVSSSTPKPAPSSQYTSKNLGGAQYGAFKAGGGDAAIRKGSSAGEVVAQGRKNISKVVSGREMNVTAPGVVKSGFDMFDVVKGYLIGEGYADTEEAALAIMANMSEDWKYSIMEQQISSVSANAPSGVKKPSVNASISAGGKTPPGQKMLDKAGQMLSGKGPSNNFGRGF